MNGLNCVFLSNVTFLYTVSFSCLFLNTILVYCISTLLKFLTELLLYSQTKNLQEITFINQTGHFTYLKFVQERSNMETPLMDNF